MAEVADGVAAQQQTRHHHLIRTRSVLNSQKPSKTLPNGVRVERCNEVVIKF